MEDVDAAGQMGPPDDAGGKLGVRVALGGLPDHEVDDPLPEVDLLLVVDELRGVVSHFEQNEEEEHFGFELVDVAEPSFAGEVVGYLLQVFEVDVAVLVVPLRLSLRPLQRLDQDQNVAQFQQVRHSLAQLCIVLANLYYPIHRITGPISLFRQPPFQILQTALAQQRQILETGQQVFERHFAAVELFPESFYLLRHQNDRYHLIQ